MLYQCGGRRPSANALPGAKVFQIPLTSVTVPDTVPYAFLVRLQLGLNIMQIQTQHAHCGSECMAYRIHVRLKRAPAPMPQEILNVTDRVHSVSSLAVAPCAQQLLTCNK